MQFRVAYRLSMFLLDVELELPEIQPWKKKSMGLK